MKTIGIIGGGITGLTCAYKLQNDYSVTLFEQQQKFGGQAQTDMVNGIAVESAVSVVGELTYIEFYKLMEEIGYDNFQEYDLSGLHVHDRTKTSLYIDANPKRLFKLFPKFIKDSPLGVFKTFLLIPFFYRLYADYRKGKLDDVLVLDAYTLYPRYTYLIPSVLSILSLITAVELKNATLAHVLNFIFDSERNKGDINPVAYLINTFIHTYATKNGVGEYIYKLKDATNASFESDSQVIKVKRNTDSSISVILQNGDEQRFDKVIIATQPYNVASFLEYKDPEETATFDRLSKLVTHSMVTNHTDDSIFGGVNPTMGLVDFRLDYHEHTPQTTISRDDHFYTAQTLPESFEHTASQSEAYSDTGITNDNYSLDPNKILSQHFHTVQHMTPETSKMFERIIEKSGDDNLHFACAALSKYPTSQEGGVRSAFRVVEELAASKETASAQENVKPMTATAS
ncbi:MAG: FAD-dependent oxidoreductase [Spongiibacteraceae bacterium]